MESMPEKGGPLSPSASEDDGQTRVEIIPWPPNPEAGLQKEEARQHLSSCYLTDGVSSAAISSLTQSFTVNFPSSLCGQVSVLLNRVVCKRSQAR